MVTQAMPTDSGKLIYHGVKKNGDNKVFVERFAATSIASPPRGSQELKPVTRSEFNWGYPEGGGPYATARAILQHALGDEQIEPLVGEFSRDFLAVCGAEFWFSHQAILRWARGALLERSAYHSD